MIDRLFFRFVSWRIRRRVARGDCTSPQFQALMAERRRLWARISASETYTVTRQEEAERTLESYRNYLAPK